MVDTLNASRVLFGEEHFQRDGVPLPIEVPNKVESLSQHMYLFDDETGPQETPWNIHALEEFETALLPYLIAWKTDNELLQEKVNELVAEKFNQSRDLERALSATDDRELERIAFLELAKITGNARMLTIAALFSRKYGEI